MTKQEATKAIEEVKDYARFARMVKGGNGYLLEIQWNDQQDDRTLRMSQYGSVQWRLQRIKMEH